MAAVSEGEVLDSWEDMDERQLDRQTAEYLARRSLPPPRPTNVVLADDDPLKLAAQPPAMKILKRPTGGAGAGANGDAKPRPVRTYLQRQQDYAAARLRILGEAGCPDDSEQIIPNVQVKTDPIRLQNANRTRERPPENNAHVDAQPRIINQPPANGVSLLRAPRGPDSSKGFNLRR